MDLQAQYENVIKTLQAAAETHMQALACNELGDVQVQRGDVTQATALWNDSLDLITGPYQVIVYLVFFLLYRVCTTDSTEES